MRLIVVGISALLLSGCVNYPVSRYAVSVDNQIALRGQKERKINVGNFTSFDPNLKTVVCRAFGPIITPNGELYSEYIRNALVDELKIADLYSIDSPITLTGNLKELVDSSTSGHWKLSLTVNSSNGKEVTVEESYKFPTSALGDNACNQTALALMPAVQNLIGKVISGENFQTLIESK